MLDLYRFQLEEISSAGLKPGEDELLTEERVKLSHSEKMMDSVSGAYELLYDRQGLESIGNVISRLEDAVRYDEKGLRTVLEQLQSSYYQLEDAAFQLRDYRENIEFNPMRLEEIENRLDLITGLRRKYGESVEQILAYYEQIHRETDLLENKDEYLEKLTAKRDSLLSVLMEAATELSEARKLCAADLVPKWRVSLKTFKWKEPRCRSN